METFLNNANNSAAYSELSRQFKELYPNVMRAYQLIGLMYNRLTLVDSMTHAEAVKKIYYDHRDLQGFSLRNIHRYLPTDNPNVPHRVMTRRLKSSSTESIGSKKLSSTKLSSQAGKIPKDEIHNIEPINDSAEVECRRCRMLAAKNQELEEALLASSRCTQAKNLIGKEIVYEIPKEKMYLLTESMKKSDKFCLTVFDSVGNFVYAEADVEKNRHNVSPDSKNE